MEHHLKEWLADENCGYSNIEDRKKAYQSVTAERLNLVANEILMKENLTVTLKGQKKKVDIGALEALIQNL